MAGEADFDFREFSRSIERFSQAIDKMSRLMARDRAPGPALAVPVLGADAPASSTVPDTAVDALTKLADAVSEIARVISVSKEEGGEAGGPGAPPPTPELKDVPMAPPAGEEGPDPVDEFWAERRREIEEERRRRRREAELRREEDRDILRRPDDEDDPAPAPPPDPAPAPPPAPAREEEALWPADVAASDMDGFLPDFGMTDHDDLMYRAATGVPISEEATDAGEELHRVQRDRNALEMRMLAQLAMDNRSDNLALEQLLRQLEQSRDTIVR